MSLTHAAAFAVVAAVFIAMPGPDWAFTATVISRGQSMLAGVAGLACGYLAMTVAVATGSGLLVARSPALVMLMTTLGACYLVWLGSHTFRAPALPPQAPVRDAGAAGPRRATWAKGLAVSGLNPKALLLFLAVLPQFTREDAHLPTGLQVVVLGLVFTLLVALFYPLLGAALRTVVTLSPRAGAWLTKGAGAVMVALGGLLLAEKAISAAR